MAVGLGRASLASLVLCGALGLLLLESLEFSPHHHLYPAANAPVVLADGPALASPNDASALPRVDDPPSSHGASPKAGSATGTPSTYAPVMPFVCAAREGYGEHSLWPRVSLKSVVFLEDSQYGQTCNAIQIVTIAVEQSIYANQSALALGPWYSRHLRALDIDYLISYAKNFTFFMDCTLSNNKSQATCGAATVLGHDEQSVLQVVTILNPAEIYHNSRMAVAGFSPLVAFGTRPYRGVRSTVASTMAMTRELESKQSKGFVFGVHRRWQEGLCPRRIIQYRFHECHPASTDSKLLAPFQPLDAYCNITLNHTQSAYLLEHSQALKQAADKNAVVLFLASDYQDWKGDLAILNHHSQAMGIAKTAQLGQLNPGCYNSKQLGWRMMLLDSWALALADLHMGNPLSSCDTLIVHWRIGMGLGSPSFPHECYDGFFAKSRIPPSERRPKARAMDTEAAVKALYSPATTRATIDPVLAVLDSLHLALPAGKLSVLARGIISRTLRPADLKKHSALVSVADEFGRTPLHFAVEVGSPDIAHELLFLGADVNVRDNEGIAPIHVAARTGDYEMLDVLVKPSSKVDLEVVCNQGTALVIACAFMNWQAAQLLIKYSALASVTFNGSTLLHISVEKCGDRVDFLSLLIGKGVDVNAHDAMGNTALHIACQRGVLTLVDFLLAKGADIDSRNSLGETPLMLACLSSVKRISGDKCARLLLDRGCDRELPRASDGKTPLQVVESLLGAYTLNQTQQCVAKRRAPLAADQA